ncbi:MAG TPA: hypothetical protein VGK67_04670 [Myxococcales bacterium]|jgi:hypothetical protein
MRRYLIFLSLMCLVSLLAGPAYGQKKANLQEFSGNTVEPTEEEIKAAKRKAAGIQDLNAFGAAKEPPPKPFPWAAVLLAVLIMGALTPVALKMYKSTHRELEDLSTFGRGKDAKKGVAAGEGDPAPAFGRRPPARALKAANEKKKEKEEAPAEAAEGEPGTPRDLVWDAVSGSNGSWVTADWVATTAGLDAGAANDEIAALVSEGYLEEARDRAGKPVYRTPPA